MNKSTKRNKRKLPACMHEKCGTFYYVHNNRKNRQWIKLARDYPTAKLLWQQMRVKLDAEKYGMDSSLKNNGKTLQQLFNEFFKVKLPTLAPETQRCYLSRSRSLIAVFGPCAVQSITTERIHHYIDDHEHKTACRGEIKLLNSVFKFGRRRGWTISNPCEDVEKPKETIRKRRVTLDEFYAVRAIADPTIAAIMDLAAITAMRQTDIVLLQRKNLTDQGIEYTTHKTKIDMIIRWTPQLRATVNQLLALQGNVHSPHVVTRERSQPFKPNILAKRFSRLMDEAVRKGLLAERFVFHDLKAFAVTEGNAQGLDAQALAGHNDARTTKRYLRDKLPTITDAAQLRLVINSV